MASKAQKVGWSAGAATLIAALTGAFVQVRPVLTDVELAKAGKARLEADMEEIRRHAIDEPVKFEIIGTSRGVVQVTVYETACLKVAGANRLVYLPSAEHQKPEPGKGPAVLGAGVPLKLSGGQCWQPPDGQCAIPPEHGTWDVTEPRGYLPDGFMLVYLHWNDGCVLEAKYNPQTGQFIYTRWLSCCSHPQ